jgi:hypothetical protein
LYGDNVKTAEGVPGGSFMHVHQAMVNVVGNELQNAHIMLKTGIDDFSEAVSGNMESKKRLKKRLTQNILPDIIIRAQGGVTSNFMIDFTSFCSTSTADHHREGKLGKGVEVRQKQVGETTGQLFSTSTLRRTETPREQSVLLRRSSIHTETEVQGYLSGLPWSGRCP